jgi:hypothetical protein
MNIHILLRPVLTGLSEMPVVRTVQLFSPKFSLEVNRFSPALFQSILSPFHDEVDYLGLTMILLKMGFPQLSGVYLQIAFR